MSRVRIGGAGGRRNVRLSRMQQRTVLSSDVPWMCVLRVLRPQLHTLTDGITLKHWHMALCWQMTWRTRDQREDQTPWSQRTFSMSSGYRVTRCIGFSRKLLNGIPLARAFWQHFYH